MNILYTFDNNFVPQVAAGMCSICENNKDIEELNFFVFSLKITDENKKKLDEFLNNKYGRNITFIELDDLKKYFDFSFDTSGWNPIVLARLLLDRLLPKNVEKILYLDGDTIVRGSLKELWNSNLHENILGACVEPTFSKERRKALKHGNNPYFNAGVLLVDLNRWRKEKIGEQIISYYKKFNGKLFANDQDAINGTLVNKIENLSIRYNYANTFYIYPYRAIKKMMYPNYFIDKEDFENSNKFPVIIHYLGEERPWRLGNTHKFRDDYEKYLNLTPWKNMGFEDGWQLYFLCWKIFNFVIKPFPILRYRIINGLIPLFMNYRSKKLKK